MENIGNDFHPIDEPGIHHYIRLRDDNSIVDGWSEGPIRDKDTTDAICINDKGSYQFRLVFKDDNGNVTYSEENPSIYDFAHFIPIYKYVDGKIVRRTQDELNAEIATLPPYLEDVQKEKQTENKRMLADYLENHPLTWTDGMTYSVTYESQQEMALNYIQQVIFGDSESGGGLLWHSMKELSKVWDIAKFKNLMLDIKKYIKPALEYQEKIKKLIYSCTTKDEVYAISIDYEGVEKSER